MTTPKCPSCGGADLADRGLIPAAYTFAGVVVAQGIPGGHLYRCRGCHLQFRYPRLKQADADKWYGMASPDVWSASISARTDWRIASEWIRAEGGTGRLLDIGCYRGDFLAGIGTTHELCGIEINSAAADIARTRGIGIVGRDFADLERQPGTFAVITAIDVIEHVPDPLALLRTIQQALCPGGMAIISTGNTAAWTWRLMGGRYWYCSYAEHIAFINPDWCRVAARQVGLTLERQRRFAHAGRAPGHAVSDLLKNLVYLCAPRLAARLRRRLRADAENDQPPGWTTATDHLIVLFRKPSEPGIRD